MSRTFDTGLTAPQRTLVVNAIITKLAPLKLMSLGGTDAKGFVEQIMPISWRIREQEDWTIDLLWQRMNGRTPTIAVAALDLHCEQAGGPARGVGELEVDIYFVWNHLRDLTEGRMTSDAIATASDTADPGVYTALELAWMYLFDVQLGIPSVHELKLRHEGEVITTQKGVIWRQEWRVLLGRDANLYRGITQKLTNFVTELNPTDDQPTSKDIVFDTTVG